MKENFVLPKSPLDRSMGEREWGTETLLHLCPDHWSMKRLEIKKGCKGGLQYHRLKDEATFVISGSLIVRYVKNNTIIEEIYEAGSSIHFPPGCIHQEEAISDCILLEVSTPHANDRVRVDEQYGMKTSGLPSTSLEDIFKIVY